MIRLGIDFGTANTVVSRWDDLTNSSQVLRIPDIDQPRTGGDTQFQYVIPSVTAFPKTFAGPVLYGGQVTEEILEQESHHVFRYTKSVAMDLVADIQVPVFEGSVRPKEAAARFLKTVVSNAQLIVNDPNLELVLTAPIESFDRYRDWLYEQVVDPAITSVRIVDEATAAAAGYSYSLSADERILIFDFGAGTLDVTVATVDFEAVGTNRSGVRVISKRGANLGGKHIDAILFKWSLGELGLSVGDPGMVNSISSRLLNSCEKAKVTLSRDPTAVIEVGIPGEKVVRRVEITREKFNDLLRSNEIFRKTNQTLIDALLEASNKGVSQDSIGAVFLVGGTSLIPGIAEIIRNAFPDEKIHLDSPLEAVAKGAASIAGGYQASDHIQHDYAIRHVDPETGTYQYLAIVESGTHFPTLKPIASKMVQASHDGQIQLGIQIYELGSKSASDLASSYELQFEANGAIRLQNVTAQTRAERRLIHLNEKSPTFLEANPPANAQQNRFRVDFEIDMLRRLTITAYDLLTKKYVLSQEPVVRLS